MTTSLVLTQRVVADAERLHRFLITMDAPRVHIEDTLDLLMEPRFKGALLDMLTAWFHAEHPQWNTSILSAGLNPNFGTVGITGLVTRFVATSGQVVAAANILNKAAEQLRYHPWAPSAHAHAGFTVVSVVHYVCQQQASPERIRALVAMKQFLNSTGYYKTLIDWNDEPGRTQREVITLLELCAAKMVTI